MQPDLKGVRVLVVEDNYFIAQDLAAELTLFGAHVVGPVPTAEAAEALVAKGGLDLVLLDIDLAGIPSYPLADRLGREGIPYSFLTGFDRSTVPSAYDGIEFVQKPVARQDLGEVVVRLRAA